MTSYTPATYWEPAECDFVEFSAAIVGVDEKGKGIKIELPQDLSGVVADHPTCMMSMRECSEIGMRMQKRQERIT